MITTMTIENTANRQRTLFGKKARAQGPCQDNIWLSTEVFPRKINMHV